MIDGPAVGETIEDSQEVTIERTASHIGSGALRVYATPAMALFVERSCHALIARHLPPEKTSVGVELKVRHMAPSPLGATVHLRAEVLAIEGERVDFRCRLWDDVEPVGEVEHVRRVVETARFLRRVEEKGRAMSQTLPGESVSPAEGDLSPRRDA
ncbi:MAG TPA: thioesterase family protein [Anaerolineales bacterium]|nr:thioesterase family protein [Anaerolineales bacterium]